VRCYNKGAILFITCCLLLANKVAYINPLTFTFSISSSTKRPCIVLYGRCISYDWRPKVGVVYSVADEQVRD